MTKYYKCDECFGETIKHTSRTNNIKKLFKKNYTFFFVIIIIMKLHIANNLWLFNRNGQ